MELFPRTCPICGVSEGATVHSESNFDPQTLDAFAFSSRKIPEYMHCRMMLCPRCDLLYADPAFPPGALAEAYREAAFDSGSEARYAAKTYAKFLRKFMDRLPDRRGALDIGTGDGVFLEELLQEGFSGVEGVEPSEAPIASSRPGIRPLIRKGIFRGSDFPPGQYSLVTCFQTLEHVPEPLATARDVYRLLKSGGCFFIISHNRKALANRLLGRRSPIFDIEHLQLFSPRSARKLLEAAGFARVESHTILNVYPLSYCVKLMPFPRGLKKALLSALQRTGIGGLPVPLPAGNLAVVGFKDAHP